MPRVDTDEIKRWRNLDATNVIVALAQHAKRDPTFIPIKDQSTTRWHVRVCDREFELLLTGPKYYDVRAEVGGGGAIDIAIHLCRIDFKAATGLLRRVGI